MSASELLIYMIRYIENSIEETGSERGNEFVEGERTAYVECLEILSFWRRAKEHGLDYEIEKRFTL